MNLLLHGLDAPNIDPLNSLRHRLSDLGDRDRVDVILTNPPFGGQEERGILSNFPADLQTTETSVLFVQLILRRLNRAHGRAGIVVPDGFLSNRGVAARVKRQMLDECNLHTIVRLPFGVFEPYTPIKTNILFLKAGQPTDGVWYYELPIVDGRKKYTKTRPITIEEFAPCIEWWRAREAGPHSWFVPRVEMERKEYSLDFRNPAALDSDLPDDPSALAGIVVEEVREVLRAAEEVRSMTARWKQIRG